MYAKVEQAYSKNAIVGVLAGSAIVVFAIVYFRSHRAASFFFLLLGAICFLWAGFMYSSGKKFLKK
jgi:1,4-dihydroxy-2-naphthoate octaprenyltransferase